MSICNPHIFFSKINKGERLLGIDYGDKFLGLAMSDEGLIISNPLVTLERKKFLNLVESIIKIIKVNKIGGIVIGWPLNMDGSQGFRCDATRDFSYAFLKKYECPIFFQDERFSTSFAKETLKGSKFKKKKLKHLENSIAASWILQSFLDSQK